jgi:hypothetical protein
MIRQHNLMFDFSRFKREKEINIIGIIDSFPGTYTSNVFRVTENLVNLGDVLLT